MKTTLLDFDVRLQDKEEIAVYRVLIVDDEPMALYSAAHAFPWMKYGFDEPVTTTDSAAALELLRNQRFDAAIVDIRMPKYSGIDLIRIGREENLPVTFAVISGYTDFSYVQTALRLQAFDYCLKPIMPEVAESTLERLAQHIRATRLSGDGGSIATMGNSAVLPRLFTERGMEVPGGPLSLVLVSGSEPALLPGKLNAFHDALFFWTSENTVLIICSMTENQIKQAMHDHPDILCCYTQPTALDSVNPARQHQLLQEMMLTMKAGQQPMSMRVNDCSPAFFELLNYVDQHLMEELSLQELAVRFHLNYTYCSELFRSTTGQTFTKYLTSHRMERAAKLIESTALSMTEIARQTGYGNYNHFSATFKNHFGQTPGSYRSAQQDKGKE